MMVCWKKIFFPTIERDFYIFLIVYGEAMAANTKMLKPYFCSHFNNFQSWHEFHTLNFSFKLAWQSKTFKSTHLLMCRSTALHKSFLPGGRLWKNPCLISNFFFINGIVYTWVKYGINSRLETLFKLVL